MSEKPKERTCETGLLRYDTKTADLAVRHAQILGCGAIYCLDKDLRLRDLVNTLGDDADVRLTKMIRNQKT